MCVQAGMQGVGVREVRRIPPPPPPPKKNEKNEGGNNKIKKINHNVVYKMGQKSKLMSF